MAIIAEHCSFARTYCLPAVTAFSREHASLSLRAQLSDRRRPLIHNRLEFMLLALVFFLMFLGVAGQDSCGLPALKKYGQVFPRAGKVFRKQPACSLERRDRSPRPLAIRLDVRWIDEVTFQNAVA
jgi:hypothetical protein